MKQKKPIFCLMGPTASGKTPLACELVSRLPLDIISVDSAMIYREMDIGTAKPTKDILAIAPHRLINLIDPLETYSAGQFLEDALREIEFIFSEHRFPLLVGGTMLYFHVLQNGIANLPSANLAIRKDIQTQAETNGWDYLHRLLSQYDPISATRIHMNDTQRIQRALEVYYITGKPLSNLQQKNNASWDEYEFYSLIIAPEKREILHQRIETRFKKMLTDGFIGEVEKLKNRGDLAANLPALRSVGYREIWQYLDNHVDDETMEMRAIAATRQLAKRQLTWLRHWPNGIWFDSESTQIVQHLLEWIKQSSLSF